MTVGNSLFDAGKLVKDADTDIQNSSGYGIRFDKKGIFSFTTGGFGKTVINVGADKSSSVHVDNNKLCILILGEDPTQGLGDTTMTAEKEY